MHEGLAVISTTIAAAITAIVADVSQVPVQAFSGPAIFDDERYRLICIVGALGGALLNLGLYSSPTPGIRPMAWKVFCSTITGVVVTPMVIHWTNIVPNVDNLLFFSFFMALISVGVVRGVAPLWTRFFVQKLGPTESTSCPPPAVTPTPQPPDKARQPQTP